MVLERANADRTKIPLFLEASGNELYQVDWLLTFQVARKTAKRQLPRKITISQQQITTEFI